MFRRPDDPPQPLAALRPAGSPFKSEIWLWVLLFAATLLAYYPSLHGDFIWDDAAHVTRPDLRPLSGLSRIWGEIGATQQYYPLLHSAFWLEHRLWGDSPLGYHLLNVVLHSLAAALFGCLLRRLAVPGAWLAASLFALHPIGVESVAWISEQKNTLSTVFYLGAALAYLRFDHQRRGAWYALAAAGFVLALLTKTVSATLPAALLVIFWWKRGRLEWRRDVVPLLPWLVVGAVMGLFTARVERDLIGAEGTDFALGALPRCLLAGRIFWFYLGKLFWPADLIFNYPRWTVDPAQAWQWSFSLGALLLLAGLILYQRRQRGPLAAGLLYAGSLFPVLGFFNVYPFLFSFVADHFVYLAGLPVFALTAAGLSLVAARWPRWLGILAAALLLLGLGRLTWGQSANYRDVVVLYQATLAKNPASWLAHNNLALALADRGQVAEAIPHLTTALRLRPGFAEAENNLGDDLARLNRPKEAIPHLVAALRLQPNFVEAHNNLGTTLLADGRPAESIPHFEDALRLDPTRAAIQNNLGIALSMTGQTAAALPHFTRAVQLQPDFAQAELNLSLGLVLENRYAEARPHFEKAVALDRAPLEARKTFARTLVQAGRFVEAVGQYEIVLRQKPDDADAHRNLAIALRRLDRIEESTRHYLEALRLNPDFAVEK